MFLPKISVEQHLDMASEPAVGHDEHDAKEPVRTRLPMAQLNRDKIGHSADHQWQTFSELSHVASDRPSSSVLAQVTVHNRVPS